MKTMQRASQNEYRQHRQDAYEQRRALRVALVNMPWARTDTPSIQCGLLQAALIRAGHTARTFYGNLDLSRVLGPSTYEAIVDSRAERLHLFGEWLFTPAVFPDEEQADDSTRSEEQYFSEFPEVGARLRRAGLSLSSVRKLRRDRLPQWLDGLACAEHWQHIDMVGFSSTFLQNVASLALAVRLRRRYPKMVIVFGGAAFDAAMGPEYVRAFPFIDYAVCGEGDSALLELASRIAAGMRPVETPGVCGRDESGEVVTTPPEPPINAMDDLPVPDYGDYFSSLKENGRRATIGIREIRLPVEFSRGCWWGQKHHCRFCGLNARAITYRARSPENAMAQLRELMTRHRVHHFDAVDNILDMRYLESFCRRIAESGWDIDLFFETKANLNRKQVALLAAAGIRRIQPGLESLSTNVLRLMRKGTSTLQNLRLLKWARYYGIDVSWNLLAGFPGETDADYQQQASLVPLIIHLQPPGGVSRIWLERFSPYAHDPSSPIRCVGPQPAYRHVYPVPSLEHEQIAYFFEYTVSGVVSDMALEELGHQVERWRGAWRDCQPRLSYRRGPDWLILTDTRTGRERTATLEGWRADAYEACGDTARSVVGVHRSLRDRGVATAHSEVQEFFSFACEQQIMVAENGSFLALALPSARRPTEFTTGQLRHAATDRRGTTGLS